MTAPPSLSDKLVPITSTLFLNAAQVATVKVDISVILIIDDDIEEYCWELQLLIDLQKELYATCDDNTDFTCRSGTMENHLEMANRTIQLLQYLTTNTLTLQAIQLPQPPQILRG
jgi:phage major head subunit gpT-like protein